MENYVLCGARTLASPATLELRAVGIGRSAFCLPPSSFYLPPESSSLKRFWDNALPTRGTTHGVMTPCGSKYTEKTRGFARPPGTKPLEFWAHEFEWGKLSQKTLPWRAGSLLDFHPWRRWLPAWITPPGRVSPPRDSGPKDRARRSRCGCTRPRAPSTMASRKHNRSAGPWFRRGSR